MLVSTIVPVSKISTNEKTSMLFLMQKYYENVSDEQFRNDLEKKDWVILLKDGELLCGFSTQVLLAWVVNGQSVRIVFSGDTVIDKRYRNSLALPLTWGRKMLSLLDSEPEIPLYWLLTTKGYKTYRYLPVFFHDYFPAPFRTPSSFEKELLLRIGNEMFDGKLNTERWILCAQSADQRLKPGAADITDAKRKIQEISYFEKINPYHARGDELVCLTKFHKSNINPLFLKKLLNP